MSKAWFLLVLLLAAVSFVSCDQHAAESPGADARQQQRRTESANTQTHAPSRDSKSLKKNANQTIRLRQQQVEFAQIKTCPVQFSGLTQELDFSSVVQAPSEDIGFVSPQMNGVVSRVLVDVGDVVKKGQVLMYVNSPDVAEAQSYYYNALSKLEEVDAATLLIKTRLNLAYKNLERLEGLVSEGISAHRDVELAQEKVASTKAELVASEASGNAARAQLSAAKVRLAALGIANPSKTPEEITTELPLYSPRSGTVVERNVIAGQGVSPLSSNPRATPAQHNALICIADLKTVWVMLEVPQMEVSKLRIGTSVKFTSEVAPGMNFDGKITRLGENFDPNTHSVLVRTEIQNPDGVLKPGMMVIAKVNTKKTGLDGLTVQSAAIQNIDGKDYVFAARDNYRFEKIPVRVVSTVGDRSQVAGDLNLNDRIVTNGAFFLKSEAIKTQVGSDY